ncbi:hypothetical protein [Paracoccus sp. 22332]|uniref:hypothetical protein n=1 Tax=Paracoccus sp. 22332 TaxID=3453913 RepID=UPI003F86701B
MEVLVAVAAAVVLLFIGLVSRWLATVLMWRRYLRPERLALTSFFDRFHWRINAILTSYAIAAMLVPLVASIALYPPDSLRDGIATLFKLVPIRQSEDIWWLFGLLLLGAAWLRKVVLLDHLNVKQAFIDRIRLEHAVDLLASERAFQSRLSTMSPAQAAELTLELRRFLFDVPTTGNQDATAEVLEVTKDDVPFA